MIYHCDSCHYLFEDSEAKQCPDCGKAKVRAATQQEQNEYKKLRIEFGYERPTSEDT
jgi:rRNA maturation endonuclease Nob1